MDREVINGMTLLMADDHEMPPCGPCKACCTVLGVEELDKPNYEPCRHECETGCAIYADRPLSCRAWNCFWKSGLLGDERRRPDNLGVIIDAVPGACRVWEVWPGAAQQPQVKYLLCKLRKEYGCCTLVVDEEIGRASSGIEWDEAPPELQAKILANLTF